jgi:hypothetical protein
MFSSPAASTPYSKARVQTTGSVSMSFGQQSALKRKREYLQSDTDASSNSLKFLRKEASVATSDAERVPVGRLYGFGQLLLQNEEHRPILVPSVARLQHQQSDGVQLSTPLNFHDTVECGAGPSDSVDIVSCSRDGNIVLVNVPAGGGTQIALSHKLGLRTEDERITTVCHAGMYCIVQ